MFERVSLHTFARRPLGLAAGVALGGAMILIGSSPASAATASGTPTVTGTTQAGALSITAPGSLTLPTFG
jgi:type 1 fimbria pilin